MVTAGKRLSRELHEQYQDLKIAAGETAWRTPDIIPYPVWSKGLWQTISTTRADASASQPRATVLNSIQSRALWKKVIVQDIATHHAESEPLWSIDSTAIAAGQAWKIAHDWRIAWGSSALSTGDHDGFCRWAKAYQQLCRHNNWIDGDEITPFLTAAIRTVSPAESAQLFGEPKNLRGLILCGFDQLTPSQRDLFESIHPLDLEVVMYQPSVNQSESAQIKRFYREEDQWQAIAQWAKQSLQTNPDQRLGIVVPDLQSCRDKIEQSLIKTLTPEFLVNGNDGREVFHIAPGKPLSEFEVVRSAMELLSLFSDSPQAADLIHRFLLSPFIADADTKLQQRSTLDFALRNILPFQLKPRDLLKRVTIAGNRCGYDLEDDVGLQQILTALTEFHDDLSTNQSHTDWSEKLPERLETMGWPGPAEPDSVSFQAIEAFKSEIQQLASLDLIVSFSKYDPLLSRLRNQLSSQSFAPESLSPRVAVIDISESSDLQFDAVWFANLTENCWPKPARPTPFLTIPEQKACGYNFASIALSHNLADIQFQRLQTQSPIFIGSYYSKEDDIEIHPSPVISALLKEGLESGESVESGAGFLQSLRDNTLVKSFFDDDIGIPYKEQNAPGGTQLIQNQASCAFKAYASQRLLARSIGEREQGLDAIDRGMLIHRVLEDIWREMETSDTLHALDENALKALIADKIKSNNNAFIFASGCELRFFDSHSKWLQQLLFGWFELEKCRKLKFTATALEQSATLELNGLRLKFKIDRIDLLDDGSIAVIDYKTGSTSPLADWVGDRPKYPQLALYAMAVENEDENPLSSDSALSVLVAAQVRTNDLRFRGIFIDSPFYLDTVKDGIVRHIEKSKLDDDLQNWQALKAHWRLTLSELTAQFQRGEAQVNPVDDQACAYCDFHALCRIYEKTERV